MQPYYNSDIDPVFYDFGCTATNVGDVVRGIPPDPLPTPNRFPREIVTSMEALLDRPGMYTWILFADQTFVAARTFTPQEILSKHKNIHRNHAEKGILAAGECRIGEGRAVVFNLESGTYMRPIAERFTRRFRGQNASDFYAEQMQTRWQGAGATAVRFTSLPLLPTQVSAANLAAYEALGYTFQRYPTMSACQYNSRRGGSRRSRRRYHNTRRRRSHSRIR